MFGNMMEMMGKLKGLQDKFKDMKERLDSEEFIAKSKDGKIALRMTNWGTVKDLKIEGSYEDNEELQDLLILTFNAALNKIKTNLESEIKQTAKENIPQIPGLNL